MGQGAYIFSDAGSAQELRRLQLIETVFDRKSREWLRSNGSLAGRRCLEVGAGAGSIADWLASEVGPAGGVVAVDSDTRFLQRLKDRVEVLEGYMGEVRLPEHAFDVVHARYVLIHNVDAAAIVRAMLRTLKPGGLLVVEEPDFSAALALMGPLHLKRAFSNVTRAIGSTFAARQLDHGFGRMLPGLLDQSAVEIRAIDYDAVVAPGASELAEMMRLSASELGEKYLATGQATKMDLEGYCEFAARPDCWGVYYATVRVSACVK